nr:transporter substrate-binding domain-containing protein [Roseibium denhamense]
MIATATPASSDKFAFAVGEWPPFVSQEQPGYGLHSKLIREIFHSQGHEISLEFFPWRRSLQLTKSGTFPATFSWSYLEERDADYIYANEPIEDLTDVYFYRKDRFPAGLPPLSFEELKEQSLTVVGVGGYWYETVLAKEDVIFQIVATEEEAWNMLYHGRADIFIENDISGIVQKQQFLEAAADEITYSDPIRTIPLYIMFSRKHPDAASMIEIWDTGMKKRRADKADSQTQ